MKQYFDELEKNLRDSMIQYKDLEGLFVAKQEALTNKKIDDLMDVDTKIMDKSRSIQPYVKHRDEIFNKIFNKSVSLSVVIEECKKNDMEQAQRFSQLKDELNTLIKKLKQLEFENMEMVNFGIKVSNKTLQIILNNISIPTSEYDRKGKALGQESLELSSVCEKV